MISKEEAKALEPERHMIRDAEGEIWLVKRNFGEKYKGIPGITLVLLHRDSRKTLTVLVSNRNVVVDSRDHNRIWRFNESNVKIEEYR